MINHKHLSIFALASLMALAACNPKDPIPEVISEETYAGGELGTTFNTSQSAYEDPTPAVEQAGLTTAFITSLTRVSVAQVSSFVKEIKQVSGSMLTELISVK